MKDFGYRKTDTETPLRRRLRTLPGLVSVICLLVLSLTLASCGDARNRRDLATRMASEEGRAEDDARIAELEAGIRSVDREVEATIEAVRKKADYWRLLGLKYMDYRMWGEALNAFGEAIAITPDHAPLHYNRGLSLGQMSLSSIESDERLSLLSQAETSYRRSLVIDSRYTPAMYGLAVLLVFELSRPNEAIPFLEDYLSIERSDISGRFLLARAYLESGRINEAMDLYDEISRIAKDPVDVDKAEDLHDRLLRGEYGQ